MKVFAVSLLVVASAAAAFASYELALVADGRKIHRFDTDSGVYLGNFGRFGSSIRDIATDATTGYVFAADNSGFISKYNYSTGNQESAAAQYTSASLNIVNGEVWSQNGISVARFNQNLALLGSFTLASSNTIHSMHVLNGRIYTLESNGTNAFTRKYLLNGTFEAALGTHGGFTSALGRIGSIRYLAGGYSDLVTAGVNISGSHQVAYTALSGTTPGFSGTYTPATVTTIRDSAATHAGGVYLGQNSANTAQGALAVISQDTAEVSLLGTSILVSPQALNVIVAPEPGSLLAFGLGGLWLLRRKR